MAEMFGKICIFLSSTSLRPWVSESEKVGVRSWKEHKSLLYLSIFHVSPAVGEWVRKGGSPVLEGTQIFVLMLDKVRYNLDTILKLDTFR